MSQYVVLPREDCIHEPEYPGDEATFGIVAWEVWANIEKTATGFKGDLIDSFDTEEEAIAAVARLSATYH